MASDSPQLEIAEERLDARTLVVSVSGELHAGTSDALLDRLTAAIRGAGAVVIDLSGVGFIDSTGLSVLLSAQRRATRAGCRIALVLTDPAVLRLFAITRLDAGLAIEPTRAAAVDRVHDPVSD